MKIVEDSRKSHWAIGLRITCEKCQSIFYCESESDFRSYARAHSEIRVVCPLCDHSQVVYRPWKKKNDQYTISQLGIPQLDWRTLSDYSKESR